MMGLILLAVEHVSVVGAQDVRLPAIGCLQHVSIVRIAHEWCAVTRVEDDNVRYVLKELRILQ
jgi:hypothetical protein